jgi:D-xylose transport system substrate-binding protein
MHLHDGIRGRGPRNLSKLGRLALVGSGALVVAACGSNSPATSSSGSTTNPGVPSSITISSFTTNIAATMGLLKPLTAYATHGSSSLLVGVILPDTTSSARWVDFDQPYLTDAFADAGYSSVQFNVQNAQGSDPTQIDDATADINLGAKVLVVCPLDGPTGLAIAALAASKGVKVVDYDRAIFPPTGTTYYDSFNNFGVGQLIGKGLESCVTAEKVSSPQVFVLDGGKDTDPNAISFADGYDSVVFNQQPTGTNELAAGTTNSLGYKLVENEFSPGWSTSSAETIFQQAFTAHPNINAVISANDEMNAEVVTDLKSDGVKAGTIPTTGQDATPAAMANILEGWQCGTVYKPIYLEAQDAVVMATALLAGDTIPSGLLNGTTTDPASSSIKEPASLLAPTWVTTANMESTVVADGFDSASTICGLVAQALCTQYGIH